MMHIADKSLLRITVILVILVSVSWLQVHAAAGRDVVLQNGRIALRLDRESGGTRSLVDRENGQSYRLQGLGFALTTERGVVHSEQAVAVKASGLAATWRFETETLNIDLHYQLGPGERFV